MGAARFDSSYTLFQSGARQVPVSIQCRNRQECSDSRDGHSLLCCRVLLRSELTHPWILPSECVWKEAFLPYLWPAQHIYLSGFDFHRLYPEVALEDTFLQVLLTLHSEADSCWRHLYDVTPVPELGQHRLGSVRKQTSKAWQHQSIFKTAFHFNCSQSRKQKK